MEFKAKKKYHCVYRLEYHLILVTKYRKLCISKELFEYLRGKTIRLFSLWDIELLEMNYEPDHIHILISAPPQICLSTMINSYKTTTSRLVRKKFSEYLSKFYWKPYFWSRSYLILSSGGASIEIIRQYIKNQRGNAAITT